MALTATEFRKNLFQVLRRVLDGEIIEIEQKGQVVQLALKTRRSKLDRLVKRDILTCTPEELEQAQRKLSKERQLDWERKWEALDR